MIEFISLFILFAGFIIGLGAVTVIDLHGFLGRKSSYWTEATIRTHKVTKPLIWLGISLVSIGGFFYYRYLEIVPILESILLVMLILNGLFLSFVVSPFLLKREKEGKASELLPTNLQFKIIISFIISFLGWWCGLALIISRIVIKM